MSYTMTQQQKQGFITLTQSCLYNRISVKKNVNFYYCVLKILVVFKREICYSKLFS